MALKSNCKYDLLAENTNVVLSFTGPSKVIPKSLDPTVKVLAILSGFPSICLNSNTELNVFPLLDGKAPEYKSTSLMKFTFIIPTGPPEDPWWQNDLYWGFLFHLNKIYFR